MVADKSPVLRGFFANSTRFARVFLTAEKGENGVYAEDMYSDISSPFSNQTKATWDKKKLRVSIYTRTISLLAK
jgi:hypothetical protein